MSTIEVIYGVSGSFTCLAGLAMMTAYTLTARWWRSHTGRMLVTYAVAETGMSAIFAAAVVLKLDPVWFRYTWVGLQITVGMVLWYQTGMIIRLHRRKEEQES